MEEILGHWKTPADLRVSVRNLLPDARQLAAPLTDLQGAIEQPLQQRRARPVVERRGSGRDTGRAVHLQMAQSARSLTTEQADSGVAQFATPLLWIRFASDSGQSRT